MPTGTLISDILRTQTQNFENKVENRITTFFSLQHYYAKEPLGSNSIFILSNIIIIALYIKGLRLQIETIRIERHL